MKKTAIIAVTFFVAQAILLAGMTPAETYYQNPLTQINTGGDNLQFKATCSFLCTVLSLYKSDAFNKMSKEELINRYGPALSGSEVRFDLEHIDLMKKGWTRYYPFSVGEKRFVARIFLTKETAFQQGLPVISEIVIEDSGVTLQILPGIDEILKDCKIKPNRIYPSFQADKSA